MVLSGSAIKPFARHELILEWTGTPNIAGNYTTINTWTYLRSVDSWGQLNAPATNQGSTNINGGNRTWSNNSNLSANQKKLLYSAASFTNVAHNADGTKTMSGSTTFNINVTFSNVFYGNQTASNSWNLNTIPRASTPTVSNFVATANSFTFNISRAATSFTHTAILKINGSELTRITNLTTSGTFNFTEAQQHYMLGVIGDGATFPFTIELHTYSGGANIGNKSASASITLPTTVYTTNNPNEKFVAREKNRTITTGTNTDPKFYYNLTLDIGGNRITKVNLPGANPDFILLPEQVDYINSLIVNSNTANATFVTDTLFGSSWASAKKVGPSRRSPQFQISLQDGLGPELLKEISYQDTNTESLKLTENNQIVIQDKSIVEVIIPSNSAKANSWATMKSVEIKAGSQSLSVPYVEGERRIQLKEISNSADVPLTVDFIDSRGNKVTSTKIMKTIPYLKPVPSFNVRRKDGFETEVLMDFGGTYSRVPINGVDKNNITDVRYTRKPRTASMSRNLIQDTTFEEKGIWRYFNQESSIGSGEIANGEMVLTGASSAQWKQWEYSLLLGGSALNEIANQKLYTFSVDVFLDFGSIQGNEASSISVRTLDSSGAWTRRMNMLYGKSSVAGKWVTVTETFTMPTVLDKKDIRLIVQANISGRIKFKNLQLVEGEEVGEWWPAFEDKLKLNHSSSKGLIVLDRESIDLDNTSAWDLSLYVSDTLNTTTIRGSVAEGKPLMFLDADKRSLGIGMFPTKPNMIQTTGGIELLGTVHPAEGYLPSNIPSNANLNSYVNAGFYQCPTNAVASTLRNSPTAVAFSLFVERHAGVKQTLTTYLPGNAIIWVRNAYSGTGMNDIINIESNWGPWQPGGQPRFSRDNIQLGYTLIGSLRRIGEVVTISAGRQIKDFPVGQDLPLTEKIPPGFRPMTGITVPFFKNSSNNTFPPAYIHITTAGDIRFTNGAAGNFVYTGSMTYMTLDPYPV